MKRLLCLTILSLPLLMIAQEDTARGIKWTTGLSWEQVKQKAKQENKYIFLDCFTTWCGPCKMMDNSTYLNDSVGNYFNEKFISVKVQMDKTKNDNDEIKKWYSGAESIGKQYHVEGFPTYIFFTPEGEIVHKAMGFRPASDFIAVAKTATMPGKVYSDEFMQYDDFVKAYKNGERNYDQYPAMIKTAIKANDTAIGYQLLRELSSYVLSLPKNKRYTKERIEMWTGLNFSSTTRVFSFIYRDGKIIDRVMGHKGYAAEFVDRIIQNEICIPFMEAKSNGIAMRGAYLTGKGLKSDQSEADWQKLNSIIRQKFTASYAQRAVLTARIEWYSRHRNHLAFVKYSLVKLKKYPPDFNNGSTALNINGIGWSAFLHSTDKKVLSACIPWMNKILQQYPQTSDFLDTYANLLYKIGRTDEAIEWQQKAVTVAPGDKLIQAALENMKQGKPTHVKLGAIWEIRN